MAKRALKSSNPEAAADPEKAPELNQANDDINESEAETESNHHDAKSEEMYHSPGSDMAQKYRQIVLPDEETFNEDFFQESPYDYVDKRQLSAIIERSSKFASTEAVGEMIANLPLSK